jgi:hypothetical protein
MRLSRRRLLAASPLVFSPLALSRSYGASDSSEEITKEAQRAAERGTDWLMRTFTAEGGCGTDIGHPTDIGCSAMVGLSLMTQGHTIVEGEYNKRVERILSYLLRCVATMPSDDITSQTQTQLQYKIGRHAHTFFATLFLSQIIGEDSDREKRVRRALDRLVDTISRTQTADGHWGDQSWAPMLGTVMGWVALRGAHYAGFRVEASANKTAGHIIRQMSTQLAQHQGSWMHQLYKNATGIRVLYAMGRDNEQIATRAFDEVLKLVGTGTPFTQAGGEEYLSFHLITETMLQKGGDEWKKWYATVRDKLIGVQNKDGSWTGHHCITSRTFCTAASVLVLMSPNRMLPISQQ